MSIVEIQAIDLLCRLVEDRNTTYAGVSEDRHGTFCIYRSARGWRDRPWPDHYRDCPVEQGQKLLARVYGDEEARY